MQPGLMSCAVPKQRCGRTHEACAVGHHKRGVQRLVLRHGVTQRGGNAHGALRDGKRPARGASTRPQDRAQPPRVLMWRGCKVKPGEAWIGSTRRAGRRGVRKVRQRRPGVWQDVSTHRTAMACSCGCGKHWQGVGQRVELRRSARTHAACMHAKHKPPRALQPLTPRALRGAHANHALVQRRGALG